MNRVTVSLSLAALLLIGTASAGAQERGLGVVKIRSGESEVDLYRSSHALLIAVSDYTVGWPDLPGVEKDVAPVKKLLEGHGFEVTVVRNPKADGLRRAFDDFISKRGFDAENRLLFYFTGHGHTLKQSYGDEMGYIVPVDAPNPNVDKSGFLSKALDMQQVEVYAKRIQSKHALFLFDSCFSGSIFALSKGVPPSISRNTAQPVRQFITSGSAEETVPDKSLFRLQFESALQGEADLNKDRFITGAELGMFLKDTVTNYSKDSQHPQYGKIRNRNLDKGDFVFVAPTAPGENEASLSVGGSSPSAWEQELAREREREALLKKAESAFSSLADLESRPAQSQAEADKRLRFWQGYLKDYGSSGYLLSEARGYVKQYESWTSGPKLGATKTVDLGGGVELTLVWIEGGTFEMGSRLTPAEFASRYGVEEKYLSTCERPVHEVTVDGFWMGQTEVTNTQYRRFQSSHSSKEYKGNSLDDDTQPVAYVSWDDAQSYCRWLSSRTGLAFRLPREAEWEYACRAGTTSVRYWGDDDASMGRYANTYDRTGKASLSFSWDAAETTDGHVVSAPVGSLKANAWGLHDMIGNVYEWCEDWYGEDYYGGSPSSNPKGPTSGEYRVLRGGSWNNKPRYCRSADRFRLGPDFTFLNLGFRVVCISPGLK